VVAALSALGGMLFSHNKCLISDAMLFIRQDFALSDFTVVLVVSAVLIGAIIGAAIGVDISDYFGRRKVILAVAAIFTQGAVVTATVHWSVDNWKTLVGTENAGQWKATYVAGLPTDELSAGEEVRFTFSWLKSQNWDNTDFAVTIRKQQ
jgi:MFS family permease